MTQTKFEFSSVYLDSVNVSSDLFEHIGTATKSLLPNPQVVVIVQDLARGIISSKLADAYISCEFLTELPLDADSLFVQNVSDVTLQEAVWLRKVRLWV